MKILIVDDNVDARMILRKTLEANGHAVEEAADGGAALERAKTAPPDMIISDILMPRMDGFQLCRAVKADDALKGLPFVFYTATYTTDKDRDFALSLGAGRFIVKPTEPEEFIGKINDVLAKGEKGLIPPGKPLIENETEYLKEHQARLIHKLEEKLDQLQEANLALVREIEERTRAHALLGKSEARLAEAQQAAHIGNWEWNIQTDDLYWSAENYRIFGLATEVKPSVKTFLDMVHPDDLDHVNKSIAAALGGEPYDIDLRVTRPDGEERWVNARATVDFDAAGKPARMFGVVLDITAQKLMEKALREAAFKYRIVANNTSDWEFWLDPEGKFVYSSPSCKVITGHAVDEFMADQHFFGTIIHPDDRTAFDKHFQEALDERRPSALQFRVVRPDGGTRWVDHMCQPVIDREGNYLGTRGSNRDITERKLAEEAVKSALAEKEVLLKEVHHRVKNNMQIISSLLNLQAQKMQSPDFKMAFEQARSRIKSMSDIHEMLYSTKDFARIDCREYLDKLVKDLAAAATVDTNVIKTALNVDEILLGVDTAIPLGLITNELVTNALKHAFSRGGGELTVSLTKAGELFTLSVKDNGVGLPEGFDYRNADTLGLQLVSVMVKQIRGSLRVSSDRGTEAVVTFRQ